MSRREALFKPVYGSEALIHPSVRVYVYIFTAPISEFNDDHSQIGFSTGENDDNCVRDWRRLIEAEVVHILRFR